jgi:hypothetical protein
MHHGRFAISGRQATRSELKIKKLEPLPHPNSEIASASAASCR